MSTEAPPILPSAVVNMAEIFSGLVPQSARFVSCRKPRPSNWSVYFIAAMRTGLVKIGFTADLPTRLRALQNSSPGRLECLLAIPMESRRAGHVAERRLHRHFIRQRYHGEWFRLEGPVQEFIRRLEGVEDRLSDIEKRLLGLEKAVLPQNLDDPLEHPHDHSDTAGPNKAVEGA